MDGDTAAQLSHEFESALSKVLPDLYQLLQTHQVSKVFLFLLDLDRPLTTDVPVICPLCCSYWDPVCRCYRCRICGLQNQDPGVNSTGGIDSETLNYLCTGIESILSASERLGQLGEQRASRPDEAFEVHLLIDTAANLELGLACQWVSNSVLECSTP